VTGLVSAGAAVILRPAADLDPELLRGIHAAVCAETFTPLGLPSAALEPLVRSQFDAQQAGYRARFPDSTDFVVWAGEQAVGRCWLDDDGRRIRIIDLAIVPERRREGFARLALESVIQTARPRGLPLVLSVHAGNASAQALYRSLGFEIDASVDPDPLGDLALILRPAPVTSEERAVSHG
jgi:ribosomal protein S18 acetylase RimI-like enzyme